MRLSAQPPSHRRVSPHDGVIAFFFASFSFFFFPLTLHPGADQKAGCFTLAYWGENRKDSAFLGKEKG